jgi:hypothetical protein
MPYSNWDRLTLQMYCTAQLFCFHSGLEYGGIVPGLLLDDIGWEPFFLSSFI